ncbi:MAG TPA: efflux RND transporter periplasmic adaptor subunit, partial [Cytophagaceae bacterium]
LNLANTQTSYEDALRTYERNKVLSSGEAITKTAFEKADLSVKSLQNSIAVLKKQMTYMKIYAPISGYITSKTFEAGSIVSPGMPIAVITDISTVKLNILVPENLVAQFEIGNTIDVTCDAYAGSKLAGSVGYISVKADDSKNFLVKVKINNINNGDKLIRAGMFGKAFFKSKQPINTLTVSRSAIVGSTKSPQLYVIEDGKAVLRNVTLGRILDNEIEITNGIDEGQLVANSGLVNLANGIKVAHASR